ncbi:ABC transporter ATP-binding protein, partial [bacterium]
MPDKMENQIAVSVQNVTKSYRLFSSITERLKEVLHPFKKTYHRDFLALSGVSLEVKKGSVFGIIGRNGSGKSTLLQIICSVSQPTSGSVAVNGRISSLLSLGAGFNPEYTGRANVMFNGSLMGFTPSEMKERLPLIQSFADIGDFFDQPVKTYSSGMYVRLAFASAINVDPDILIIDEALAVGDARFQQKCYQKFNDFKDAGKTIILVTHDTGAVLTHCENAVLLDNGSIIENGHPKDVVNRYFDMLFGLNSAGGNAPPVAGNIENNNAAENRKNTKLDEFLSITPDSDNCFTRKNYNKNEYRYGDRKAEIIDYLVICGNETDSEKINSGDLVEIYYKVRFHHDMEKPAFGFSLHTIG